MNITRCGWAGTNPLMIAYHDEEWGEPLHDDRRLFEFLILEGMQAGLSWNTILNKRENFRRAFDNFDPQAIAQYSNDKLAQLLTDTGIIRNRLKINAAVLNAQNFMQTQAEYGTFDAYIWQFTAGRTIVNHFHHLSEVPATTTESDAMSRDLIKRGFKFVGSTICYAHMQATGMVNDHLLECFKRKGI